jgi:hypothetical protein
MEQFKDPWWYYRGVERAILGTAGAGPIPQHHFIKSF